MKFVCDDFGLHPSINKAILNLADKNKTDAASAMANLCNETDMKNLNARGNLEIGLHLNFTCGLPLADDVDSLLMPDGKLCNFGAFLRRLIANRICRIHLKKEIQAQVDFLLSTIGRLDHVDGHQHIHYLPQVRSPLIAVLKTCKLEEVRVRSGLLLPPTPKYMLVNSLAVRYLPKAQHKFLLDYSYDYKRPSQNCEVMLHVAAPHCKTSSSDDGSFSWAEREKQYRRRMGQDVLTC